MPQEGATGIYLPPIRIVNRGDLRVSDEPEAEFRFGKDKRYKPMEGSIDLETQYYRDYKQKPLAPTKMIRPDRPRENLGTFFGQPSYKDDYKAYDLSLNARKPRQYEYRPPSKKFEGTSNYSVEFLPHHVTAFKSAKPLEPPKQTTDPFPTATAYRDSFPKYSHSVVARQQAKRPLWQPPLLTPMSDVTNYKSDYSPKELHVTASCKPEMSLLKTETAFEDLTTQKTSYVDWKVVRPMANERPEYKVPDGEFDFTTTHSLEFVPRELKRAVPLLPVSQLGRSLPAFDGTTNYGLEFPARPLGERPKRPKKQTTDVLPFATAGPFNGEPTYTVDYVAHEVTPRKDHRPNHIPLKTEEKFPDNTDYRDSFVRYQLPDRQKADRPAWQPNSVKLDTVTTYRSEFLERELVKTGNFKPDSKPLEPEFATEYRTTHLDSFTPWKYVNDGTKKVESYHLDAPVCENSATDE